MQRLRLHKEYFEPGGEMDEFIEVFELGYYNALGLQKYNDVYGLIWLEKKAHDVYHKQWVWLSKWKDGKPVPVEKKRPMAIYLGDRESAIKMLESFLDKLKP